MWQYYHSLLAVASLIACLADESIVITNLGSVQGIVGSNYRVFEGVPYAAPPVGDLRWEDPQPVAPWAPAVWNATVDPPGCYQECWEDEPPHICPATVSEDCLYLNIWTPRMPTPPPTPLPIMLFIHGGNFHDGYAGGLDANGGVLYDGRYFVSNADHVEAIVVVINYRLGALGWLYMGQDAGITGNYGLKDQVMAMEWTRANIAAFGGDPDRVTLFGQSAGAMSISCHLSRPQTNGLYVGAIMQSNPHAEPYRDVSSQLAIANAFANYSGCNIAPANLTKAAACLRTKDPLTLLNAQMASEIDLIDDLEAILQVVVAWSPAIGTPYLPVRPLEAFQGGNVNDVPIIIGTTSNETVIFIYEALTTTLSQLEYELAATVIFASNANYQDSLALYPYPVPPPADGDYRLYAAPLLTDGLFLCPTRNATEALQSSQPFRRSPIWHYQYSHQLAASSSIWRNFTECDTEVCHGSDLPMWWHPLDPGVANFTQEEDALSSSMQSYWANFAATGIPTAQGAPSWPAYSASTRPTLNFETASMGGITVVSALRDSFCTWWDSKIGYHIY